MLGASVLPERVLILGGGGREHALALGMLASPSAPTIHALPGNAGTAQVGTNHEGRADDAEHVLNLVDELGIDLVVIGPEAPLAAGIADVLRGSGYNVFRPGAEIRVDTWEVAWSGRFQCKFHRHRIRFQVERFI